MLDLTVKQECMLRCVGGPANNASVLIDIAAEDGVLVYSNRRNAHGVYTKHRYVVRTLRYFDGRDQLRTVKYLSPEGSGIDKDVRSLYEPKDV